MGDFTIRGDVTLDTSKVQSEAKQLGQLVDRVVNTKLGGKDSKLSTMQNQLLSARKQAEKLDKELTSVAKVPTPEYENLQTDLKTSEKEVEKLSGKLRSLKDQSKIRVAAGKPITDMMQQTYNYYTSKFNSATGQVTRIQNEMKAMENAGTAFKIPDMTSQIQQLQTLNDKIKLIVGSFSKTANKNLGIDPNAFQSMLYPADEVSKKLQELTSEFDRLSKQYMTLTTTMNSSNMGSEELKKATDQSRQLSARMTVLLNTISGMSAGESSIQAIESEMEKTSQEIQGLIDLRQTLSTAMNSDIPLPQGDLQTLTTAFDALGKRIEINQEKLAALQQLLQKINDEKVKPNVDEKPLMTAKQWASTIVSSMKSAFNETVALFKRAFNTMNNIVSKLGTMLKRGVVSGLNAMKSALQSSLSLMRKFASASASAFSSIAKGAKNAALHMKNHTKETDKSSMSFKKMLTMVLQYGFGIRSIYFMVRKLRAYVADGFSYLYKADAQFKSSIDSFKGSLDTLKLAITGAFEPLVTMAIPYLQKLIGWLISAVNAVAQFIAALTGKSTYKKAITQTKSLADTTKDLTKEQKENAKASKQQLSGLDKLNNLTTPSDSSSEDPVIPASDLWEDAEVDSKIKNLADKFKEVAEKLFAPIKRAWDEVGKYVKDQWKYMWSELGKLGGDILRDFLKAWDSDLVTEIWKDIFTSVGNIFKMVGNLARQFRIAWNTNEVGYKIFLRIFELLKIISGTVKDITGSLAEWAGTLDFYPLLSSIERLLDSMKGPVKFICDSIKSFVEAVFEPFVKYLLEVGVPKIFKAFEKFNRGVNWSKLTDNVKRFNKALEPLLELTFDAFVKGLDWLLDALKKFLNGNFIDNFVKDFENFVKALQNAKGPMDVINAVFEFFNKRMKATLQVANGIVGSINNFLTKINTIDPKTGTTPLQDFAKNFSETINNILGSIDFKDLGSLLSNVTTTMLNFFTSVFKGIDKEQVKQSVEDFLTGIDWVGVFTSLKDFLLSAGEILLAVKDGVLGAINKGLESITPTELGQKVGDLVHNLFTSISNKLSEMNNDGTLLEIGKKIGDFIAGMNWEQIFNDIGNLLSNLWLAFRNVLAGILDADSNSWSDISDKIAEVIGNLPWDKAWEGVKELLKDAISLLFKTVSNIISNNPEMATDLAKAFSAIVAAKLTLKLGEVAMSTAIKLGLEKAIKGVSFKELGTSIGSVVTKGAVAAKGTIAAAGTSIAGWLGTSVGAASAGSIAGAGAVGLAIGGIGAKIVNKVIGDITDDPYYKNFTWFGDDEYAFKNVGPAIKDWFNMTFNKTPFEELSSAIAKVKDGTIPTTEEIDKMAKKYGWTESQVKMLEYAIAQQTGTLDQWKQKYSATGESIETTTVEMDKAYSSMGKLDGEVQTLTKSTDSQKSSWSSFWGGLGSSVSTAWTSIKTAISTGWGSVTSFFSTAWSTFKTNWSNFWTGLGTNISTVWTSIVTSVSTGWNNIVTFFSTAWTTFTTNWTTFWSSLGGAISTAWTTITTALSTAWNNIVTFFTTAWTTFTTNWTTFWTGISTALETVWTNITTSLTTTWNNIVTFFTTAWSTFTTNWDKFWNDLSTNVSKIWTDIKTNICKIWTDLKTNISTFINDIKTNVTNTFTNMKTSVENIFTSMWNAIKGVINSIIGGVEKMANGVVRGINRMIDALNNLSFDVPDWVPEIGGRSFGFSIPTISDISIPRLAQGTVVPPRMGEFAAILGDNNKETEVVSPLSTMKQAMLEAIMESGMLSGGQSSGDMVVNIDGREVFRAVRKQSDMYKRSNGVSAFV